MKFKLTFIKQQANLVFFFNKKGKYYVPFLLKKKTNLACCFEQLKVNILRNIYIISCQIRQNEIYNALFLISLKSYIAHR